MARTTVFKDSDGDQTPFLRGILTQSLVNAGLSFDDAYALAQEIRDQLRDADQISTAELSERTAKLLTERYGEERCRTYLVKPRADSDIIVHAPTRSETFSVGTLAHSLRACAIDTGDAMTAAHRVHDALRATGHKEIDHKGLRRVIYRCLREHCSSPIADRYLSWRRFENSGDPLVLLIGGISGSGKSTISTELGYRLDISRMQSTDMIREIIRAYLAKPVAPTLQYSSFEAWRGLPTPALSKQSEMDTPIITGFLSQLNTLKPALDAAVARAVLEREWLILEGVHVVPTELDLEQAKQEGVVLRVMIATMQKKTLSRRLKRRGREKNQRAALRYLERLDDIWELQSYLLSLADSEGITIIQNWNLEETIRKILEVLSIKINRRYPPSHKNMNWDN